MKITATSLLFINLPDHKSQKHTPQTSAVRARVPSDEGQAATRVRGAASPRAHGNVRAPGTRQNRTRCSSWRPQFLTRALRSAGSLTPGVTMHTMLNYNVTNSERHQMFPKSITLGRKVKMSDSYGQHELLNEKPNCLAYILNETRALFSRRKIYM